MNMGKSGMKIIIADIVGKLIGFIGLSYFTKQLSPNQIGIFFLFHTVLRTFMIPSDVGIRRSLEKRLSEDDKRAKTLTSAILLKLSILITTIIIIMALENYINNYIGVDSSVFLIIAVVAKEVSSTSISVLKGELKVGKTALAKLGNKIFYVSSSVLLLEMGYDGEALIYGLIIGMCVMVLTSIIRIDTRFAIPDKSDFVNIISFSKYSFLSSISGFMYNWLDVALIGLLLTQSAVGGYEVAWRFSMTVVIVSQAVGTTIFPQVSRWHSQGELNNITELISGSITAAVVFIMPAIFGASVLSREILTIIFSNEYIFVWDVLIVLVFGKLFQGTRSVLGPALQGINKPKLAVIGDVTSLMSNLFLNIILISLYGLIGAAIATISAIFLYNIVCYYYLSKYVDILIEWKNVGWILLCSLFMCAAVIGMKEVIGINSILELVVTVLISALIYLLLLSVNNEMRLKTKDLVSSLFT